MTEQDWQQMLQILGWLGQDSPYSQETYGMLLRAIDRAARRLPGSTLSPKAPLDVSEDFSNEVGGGSPCAMRCPRQSKLLWREFFCMLLRCSYEHLVLSNRKE